MKLKNKDIRILTIHSSGTKRQMINQALRDHGYQDVTGAPDGESAKELLETQEFQWILTPVLEGSKINGLSLLGLALTYRPLNDLKVTFLLEEPKEEVSAILYRAFEMGLLSYIQKADSKLKMEEEITHFFNCVETHEGEPSLIAAEYLRALLKQENDYKRLLNLEKSMIKLISDSPRLLLNLGEAHCLCDEIAVGHKVLDQAKMISSAIGSEADAIKNAHPLTDNHKENTDQGCNVLNIKKLLLVENNPEDAAAIKEMLAKVGAEGVHHMEDSKEALKWVEENKDVEIILFEWRLKDLQGPIFCQKVRDILGFKVPLSVMNQSLKESDIPILREMGVTDRIRKPLNEDSFIKDIIWIINQDRRPTDPATILAKIHQAITDKDRSQIANLKKKYFEHPEVTEADKQFVNAQIAYGSGFYQKAKQYASEVLMLGGDSVQVLNLLGKSMMKLREFDGALRCLENAQVISPTNVMRLCCIAESHLENGDDENFDKVLSQAKMVDHENRNIQKTEAKGALKKGDHHSARDLMSSLSSLSDIVAFTNNRAVALIRNDRFDDGVSLYHDALLSIPSREKSILATLYYNLGLAMARSDRLEESLDYLQKAKDYKIEHLKLKIYSLRKRVKQALENGEQLELKLSPMRTEEEEGEKLEAYLNEMEGLLSVIEFVAGERGLYKIFYHGEKDETCEKMLKLEITLKNRKIREKPKEEAS